MKMHLDKTRYNTVRAYDTGQVTVNDTVFNRSVLIGAQTIDSTMLPDSLDQLTSNHAAQLAELGAEIFILGTGQRQRFPKPELLQAFYAKGIGLEIMDTGAACRTYNVLVGEGRIVFAALLLA